MIFNMVGGGGAGGASIFIVNSVNERPTNVFNNTLWVNTGVDVVKYVFSDNEPSNPTEGMLWLTISNSDNVNVAAPINKDWMKFNLGIVRQYIGGAWERKMAQLYKDGIWVDVSRIFSATISITYPANSTCVVKNSSGQTVASNTNTGTSAKTWTAIVNASGTYTIIATATDGSGNSKSQSVSITAEGQLESVTLSFRLYLLRDGVENSEVTGGLYYRKNTSENKITPSDGVLVCTPGGSYYNVLSSGNAFDVTEYKTLYVSATLTGSAIDYLNHIGLINKNTASSSLTNLGGKDRFIASETISTADYTGANMVAVDISSLSGEYKFAAGWCNETGQTTAKFYDIYLE